MRVIYVDDEQGNLENFKVKTRTLSQIEELHLFQDPEEALYWVRHNSVDLAFLDIDMPTMNGIRLGKSLKEVNPNLKIAFVTAYSQYALDAFGIHAMGYLLKPYMKEEVEELLELASLYRPQPQNRVRVKTIPELTIWVDDRVFHFKHQKAEELLALFIDRMEAGVTSGEGIACLWPDKPDDEKTRNLYRVTYHRMIQELKEAGIDDLIQNEGRRKYIKKEEIQCDLYEILAGDEEVQKEYAGEYLRTYSWGETRNAQLTHILKIYKN